MASFFQPGFDDLGKNECKVEKFEIFCNSILPTDRLFATWHQIVALTVGATAILVPISLFLIYSLITTLKRRKSPSTSRSTKHARNASRLSGPASEYAGPIQSFRATKSFHVVADLTEPVSSSADSAMHYDLVVFPVEMQVGPRAVNGVDGIETAHSSVRSSRGPAKMALARLDIDSLDTEGRALETTADMLVAMYVQQDLAGYALRCSPATKADKIEKLLEALYVRRISAILLCHHDMEALDSIDLFYASGVIIENACILASGERRDYFRARRLREMMTRCAREREEKPEFFIGFLDLWSVRPHPAVIKRAVKLAEHFGAVFEHGPVDSLKGPDAMSAKPSRTIGGFEHLRRAEILQLQSSWASEARDVYLDEAAAADAAVLARLPLNQIQHVVPEISELLRNRELPNNLKAIQDEVLETCAPPVYLETLSSPIDFWETDQTGQSLSSRGCFPISSEPRDLHYDAVVETQVHLSQLRMLHPIEGNEEQALLASLKSMVVQEGCAAAVHDLVRGLAAREIRVYKGLDTGFRAGEGDAWFWGVSRGRDENAPNCVDLFISQKAPSDVDIVLHTWLAHCGSSRSESFRQELLLEATREPEKINELPLSIRAAIDSATVAEILALRQKLRMSQADQVLGAAVDRYSRSALLEDTTKAFWRNTCARKVLDSTMSMQSLLELRLDHHARRGARQLPALDDLVRLYGIVERTIEDSLFFGKRETLAAFTSALTACFGPTPGQTQVDISADFFALIYFSALRKAAFEDVYLETTDRCPLFLSHPDQAAVFSELWVLGSQCESYFGLPPRDIGEIIYDRYNNFLGERPPKADDRSNNEIMTMYSSTDATDNKPRKSQETPLTAGMTQHEITQKWKKRIATASAMSIFCLPAILDVLLLTLLGRGIFMTAFMEPQFVEAAGYALLTSLLLTAGVTGWVGSTGNYYQPHYAYTNMIYFHVQRLSGGFILALLVSIFGIIGFSLRMSVSAGFIFAAYLLNISTYLNLLGIMSTMHQQGSPLSSGRNVFLQTVPLLLISPILSSFVNGYDLEIYLPVMYGFLFLSLWRYRRLCREWSDWMSNIPTISAPQILDWYTSKLEFDSSDDEKSATQSKTSQDAQIAFKGAVEAYNRDGPPSKKKIREGKNDSLVAEVANALPYIDWLFKKGGGGDDVPEIFTTAWFTKLGDAIHQQRQVSQGLKDHNALLLFRMARYDLGQNLGLFLVALLDRWVMIVMSARDPYPSMYTDSRARYGFCLSIIYFCLGAMLLDTALYKYWSINDSLSEEKLQGFKHAQVVMAEAEKKRKEALFQALTEILGKLLVLWGIVTTCLWLLIESKETTIFYYCYSFGYTCALIFQFNRCFTTNVSRHVTIILCSALVGFLLGCLLHALPWTAAFLYTDILAQNVAGLLSVVGTSLWAWKDWSATPVFALGRKPADDELKVNVQRRILTAANTKAEFFKNDLRKEFIQANVRYQHGTNTTHRITELLNLSISDPNKIVRDSTWSQDLLQIALDMWTSGRVTFTVLSTQHFIQAGLGGYASLSYTENGMLHVAVCFNGEADRHQSLSHSLLANVISEALLYHVAQSELYLPMAAAVQAEHMLHGIEGMSRRIESEIISGDVTSLQLISRKTWMELTKQLCLEINVDSDWEALPESVREIVLSRIDGKGYGISPAFVSWASTAGADLSSIDFHVNLALKVHQKCLNQLEEVMLCFDSTNCVKPLIAELPAELKPVAVKARNKSRGLFRGFMRGLVRIPFQLVKWIAIISGAASDIERELDYLLRGLRFRVFLLRVILLIWKACWRIKNVWVYWLLLYQRPALVKIARIARKGIRRKISRDSVVVELTRDSITGFAFDNENGTMALRVFNGTLTEAPEKGEPLFTATYDDDFRLRTRIDTDSRTSTFHYDAETKSRMPSSKEVTDKEFHSVGFYDKHGRIVRGTLTIQGVHLGFQYRYKLTPKGNSDILRADFTVAGTRDTLSVFWGQPTDEDEFTWVPSKLIGRITRNIAGKTYTTYYDYQHRRDPTITTFLEEGKDRRTALASAPQVFDHEMVLLAIPKGHSFDSDDLLIYHNTLQVRQMRRYARKATGIPFHLNPVNWIAQWNKRVYSRVPTWRIRTELWGKWLKSNDLDAVTACWVDELILREEPLLRKYWRCRDAGKLAEAREYLDSHIDQIVSAIDIETDISELTLLSIRTADLYAMGLGKDANPVTSRPQDCFNDTKDRISVIFNDIGCWPIAPGGVSNCRRDLVNGHSTIRNHVLAECANDYGIPRFQVERNVQSLKLLPLWGLDGGTANHGVIDNLLESQVDEKVDDTDIQRDIVGTFVPLIMEFVKGARTKRYSRADLVRLSNVVLSMAKYYEHKDYTRTWKSKEVEQAWIAAWLLPHDDPNIASPEKCFDISRPSMFDFRQSLHIYLAYFFIFAVGVPEKCPRVFQSTHHGISSLFGMVLKYRRGVTFGIWDHAILWRECCLNMSVAQSELPVSVQSMLLAGIGLATRLAYFHADVVMPCASLFNPMWEWEIGADGSRLCSRNMFRRKIDPIVNGISNMDAYKPVDKVRTDKPTVVMLSNVQFIKGVKAAIQAADIIINRFGFSDYQLVVYGAKDRQPSYALEMERLIVENGLSGKVTLAGFGNSKEVLKDAWLFMNSSISEGLPLAIGEAALAGVPIVATEVGATALVLTDPERPDQRYGEVVPPNDPLALARAQISMLSMVGPWAEFTDRQETGSGGDTRPAVLPDEITPKDVEWLTRRFYERSDDRRKLGLLSRQVVLHSFHGSRYLREHEQMYWIQWHMAMMRADPELQPLPFKFGAHEPLRYEEEVEEEEEDGSADSAVEVAEKRRPIVLAPWRSPQREQGDLESGLRRQRPVDMITPI